jgi:hypothetical protein
MVVKIMMSISKENEILEEDLVMDLEWLREEFEILFDPLRGSYTELDQELANDVLDIFLENTDVGGNIELPNFLNEVVENIEKKYSKLLQ